MHDFEYLRPETLKEACSALEDYENAKILSGGQSLLPMLRQRVVAPDYVVDIGDLPDRDYVDVADGEVSVGCLARYVDVQRSAPVRRHRPVLAEMASLIGDGQVRNHGTLCGAIAHADPAGDPPVLATALDATIEATSVDGKTTYDAADFFHGFYETALDPGELVTEVRVPVQSAAEGGAYEKYEPSEGAYPTATVAVVIELDGDTVASADVVVGVVEPAPTRVPAAERRLEGAEPDEETVVATAESVGEAVDPVEGPEGSAEFKTEIVKTLTKRGVDAAVDRAGVDPSRAC